MKTILVTGGSGLVGNAIKRYTKTVNPTQQQECKYIFASSKDCNLELKQSTLDYFNKIKPDYVIHLAAKVGGLYMNMTYPVDMIESNLLINHNVLYASNETNVEKCMCILSTCIFPDKTTYPIDEDMLHDGPPHQSNAGYAYVKRLLDSQCEAYRTQYKRDYWCVIPCNIYGESDNYHLENAHVIPALIHKCYLAKQNNEKFVVRGTGVPLRQFIYSLDLAGWIMVDI
jgi:GDP-L-fucose synthase